jgi:diguanylate cyclase (GGDEF)-like protein
MAIGRSSARGWALSPPTLIGAASVVAGSLVAAGWLVHSLSLVRGGLDGPVVVLSAALCMILSGAGLLTSARPERGWRIASGACAALLVAIGSAVVAETALGVTLGVDFASAHLWLNDGDATPGRMSPIAGAGFAIAGIVLLMIDRSSRRLGDVIFEALVFIQIIVGIVGLLSNWLEIDSLYGWQEQEPVTVPLGVGMVLLGLGTWLRAHAPDLERTRVRREDWHITMVAGEILAAIALIAGLSGFAIVQQSIKSAIAASLEDNLADRRRSFENAIRAGLQMDAMVANRPVLARAMDQLSRSWDEQTRLAIEATSKVLVSFGYKRVAFKDLKGVTVASAGDAADGFDMAVALSEGDEVQLAWGPRGFVLLQQLPVRQDDEIVGYAATERFLLSLTATYQDVAHIGRTADTAICARHASESSCFPTASSLSNAARRISSAMALALSGEQGLLRYKDFRGKEVIAAYGPVGTLGLGVVLKIDVEELYAPIRRQLEIVAPILLLLVAAGTLGLRTQLMPLARRLRELATIDGLTGAFNRRAFMRLADTELAVARRYRRPMSVMMIDADHFKKINDSYGHEAGDAVLRVLSATCREQLRDVDLFGRLGGEEFAVALPETPLDAAQIVAERIRLALGALEVPAGDRVLRFTVSVGVSARSAPSDTIEVLLKHADEALYAAKNRGRNRVELARRDETVEPAGIAVHGVQVGRGA